MDDIKIMLCVTPTETSEASQSKQTLCHMAYRIGSGFRLYRSGIGVTVRGGMLFLTDYGLDTAAEYSSILIHDIKRECDLRNYHGIVCDFENAGNKMLERFVYEASAYFGNLHIDLYVPVSYADSAPAAHVLISSAVTGGAYQEYLSRSLHDYTTERAVLFYEPLCIDFVMPMPVGENDRISRTQLNTLIQRLNTVSYYSRELSAYYFTYRDEEKRSRFVLFDDERSMIKKVSIAHQMGYREAFLPYAEARDSLTQLKEI